MKKFIMIAIASMFVWSISITVNATHSDNPFTNELEKREEQSKQQSEPDWVPKGYSSTKPVRDVDAMLEKRRIERAAEEVEKRNKIIFWIIITIISLLLYLAPAIYAFATHKKHAIPILLLTVVFGWTGFVWVGALVWAAFSPEK